MPSAAKDALGIAITWLGPEAVLNVLPLQLDQVGDDLNVIHDQHDQCVIYVFLLA